MTSSIAPSEKNDVVVQQVADIPYASLLAKIGSASLSSLILGNVSGEDLHWISADRAVIVTRNGRVIRTAGFPQNLNYSRPLDGDPLGSQPDVNRAAFPHRRQLDISPGDIYGAIVTMRMRPVKAETIEILGRQHATWIFEEDCEVQGLKWFFTNTYWRDRDSGFIWRSRQHYVPSVPPMEIDVAKPYSG